MTSNVCYLSIPIFIHAFGALTDTHQHTNNTRCFSMKKEQKKNLNEKILRAVVVAIIVGAPPCLLRHPLASVSWIVLRGKGGKRMRDREGTRDGLWRWRGGGCAETFRAFSLGSLVSFLGEREGVREREKERKKVRNLSTCSLGK